VYELGFSSSTQTLVELLHRPRHQHQPARATERKKPHLRDLDPSRQGRDTEMRRTGESKEERGRKLRSRVVVAAAAPYRGGCRCCLTGRSRRRPKVRRSRGRCRPWRRQTARCCVVVVEEDTTATGSTSPS
jgi:hypothetical protein